jgi:hypothetical protein
MQETLVLVRLLAEVRPRALFQVAAADQAGAAGGLVGADHDPADPRGVVQRLDRHDHLRGRAVGAGDDPLVFADVLGIHLGDHQRHGGIHPPVAALVDHDRAALDRLGNEIAGRLVGRAGNRQIHPLEGRRLELLHQVLLSGKTDLLAGRAG